MRRPPTPLDSVDFQLEKRHAKHFLIALLLSKAVSRNRLYVVEKDGWWLFNLPCNKAVYACWFGFIAGKKIGYGLGGFWPETWDKVIYPSPKEK